MSPTRIILTAIAAVLAVVWIPAAALIGADRQADYRLDNIETIAMAERGAR